MKKNLYIIGLFSCLALIQIATPVSMIVRREITLRNGVQFRFRTAPVDPYDAFRGRYVALRMEQDKVAISKGLKLQRNQRVYALLREDGQGFAEIFKLEVNLPKISPYLEVDVRYVSGAHAYLRLPFDRYYMEEKAAPIAEAVYRKYSSQNKRDAYVTVRIKSGFAVLEELYVGGEPISEFIEKHQK